MEAVYRAFRSQSHGGGDARDCRGARNCDRISQLANEPKTEMFAEEGEPMSQSVGESQVVSSDDELSEVNWKITLHSDLTLYCSA